MAKKKDYQYLFGLEYRLTAKEQEWCRAFENHSGFEPIYCEMVTSNTGFYEMTQQNHQWLHSHLTDAITMSELAVKELEYYDNL